MTASTPAMPAAKPFRMESEPSEAPTVFSCSYFTLAGNEPALRLSARSDASCWLGAPSMIPLSLIWPLNGGRFQNFSIEHDRGPLADVRSRIN